MAPIRESPPAPAFLPPPVPPAPSHAFDDEDDDAAPRVCTREPWVGATSFFLLVVCFEEPGVPCGAWGTTLAPSATATGATVCAAAVAAGGSAAGAGAGAAATTATSDAATGLDGRACASGE